MGVLELFDLSGRTAVVTGGARGIGLALSEGLAAAGATVVIADILADQADQAAGRLQAKGRTAKGVFVDVTKRETVQQMTAAVLADFGKVDVLVNCAGILYRRPIEEVPDEEWDAMVSVNLRGIFLCCQVVGREMIKRKQGKIISISSNIVQPLQPLRGVYAVTKAGVTQLTRVLALEWAPHHINVNAIAPAPTLTDLNRKYFEDRPEDFKARVQSIPLGRMGDPRDYVGMAIFLAAKASDFVTGQTYFVDGGSNLI